MTARPSEAGPARGMFDFDWEGARLDPEARRTPREDGSTPCSGTSPQTVTRERVPNQPPTRSTSAPTVARTQPPGS